MIVGPLAAIGGDNISFRLAGCAWLLAGREEPRKRAKDILSLRPDTHHGQYVGTPSFSVARYRGSSAVTGSCWMTRRRKTRQDNVSLAIAKVQKLG